MATGQGQTNVRSILRVKEPEMYDVLMLNDDFTTMDFVVKVLRQVFFHTANEAERIMLEIHHRGMSVVGTFTLDLAQSKTRKATQMAREEGFPLRLKIKKKE